MIEEMIEGGYDTLMSCTEPSLLDEKDARFTPSTKRGKSAVFNPSTGRQEVVIRGEPS